MPDEVFHVEKPEGLSQAEVDSLQMKFGKNIIRTKGGRRFTGMLIAIVKEPMFLLLSVACTLYFILGETAEGFMTITAMMIVTAISVYQDVRSTKALDALQKYTRQKTRVLRDDREQLINAEELVPGDVIILEEGNTVPADAKLIQENDLTVDESLVTGESLPSEKQVSAGMDYLYQGTTINSGRCYARIVYTGSETVLGKIGKSVNAYEGPKTLLQKQVNRYVKQLALFGIAAFLLIWLVNYLHSGQVLHSLLFGLTLAMAAVPEEIPVAFSTFMALGAYQMSRLGIISRQPQVIENLGTVSVICLDKTGTITMNKMTVKAVYGVSNNKAVLAENNSTAGNVLGYAMLASEHNPFDAMEKAIHEAYRPFAQEFVYDGLQQVYEYPLEGKPPMMTHIFASDNERIAAAKGAAERILKVCKLDETTIKEVNVIVQAEAAKGYRIIGVASAICPDGSLPLRQDDFAWKLEGLLCLYDPPKENIREVIGSFYNAGIQVKLLTGDFLATAVNIAEQAGFTGYLQHLTGEQVMAMEDGELKEAVKQIHIFARMFPEAKERVISCLQQNGEVVAMTGDGVNDVPALRKADIGIAMGERGTTMAREAADLVITDDNLAMMTEAVRQGRKIFLNLKKSIRYIISIHIPIILTAALPVMLNWRYPNIFTPVHIIFLELIMGPTCSVFFEREPVEGSVMKMPARDRKSRMFPANELMITVFQGLVIAATILGLYYFTMEAHTSLEETRTLVFTTLLIANVFLTFANRSFTEHFFITVRYKNSLVPWVLLSSVAFIVIIHAISPVRNIFGLTTLSWSDFVLCTLLAFVSVAWFEFYKLYRNLSA